MPDPNLPLIDDGYVRHIFDVLSNMDVVLDSDPIAFGPKRLNGKVALCREYLSKCQRIYLQIANDLGKLNRAHRQSKLDFDLQIQDLFANDPDVRSGKNVRDREAVATMKLRDEREQIMRLESSVQDLDAVLTVVKAKREDLKDIQGRIRDQVKLCQEEIGLGERWGSALPAGSRINLEDRPRINTAVLEAMQEAVGDLDGDTSISDLEQFVAMELGEPTPTKVEAAPVVEVVPVVEVATATPVEIADPLDDLFPEEAEIVKTKTAETKPANVLPDVVEKAPPAGDSSEMNVLDSFLDELDTAPPTPAAGKKAVSATPPPVADFDIDDLLGDISTS